MPTSKSHRIIEDDTLVVPVTVQKTVGEVTIGGDSGQHPLIVAFQIISEYEADKGDGGTYTFQDTTITVEHDHGVSAPDSQMAVWLEKAHPAIFSQWVTGA